MTRILREIIGGREPTFSNRIKELEDLTGRRTLDIELTADMLAKLSDATKKLKLDPFDTTPEEIYAALKLRAMEHDQLLRDSYHNELVEMIRKINHHEHVSEIPVIKQSTLRSIIGDIPPKKVMACLGYRSVNSLLKRADLEQVLVGAFILESVTWHRTFSKKLKQCKVSDITLDKPKVIIIDEKFVKDLQHPHNLPYVQFAGLIGVSGVLSKNQCGWLEIAARAADGLFYVHQRGVYLKLFRFQTSILKKIVEISYLNSLSVTKVSTIRVSWASVYSYINRNLGSIVFTDESAVDKSDFKWSGPVELLRNVHHLLDFWKETRITAKPTNSKPVSLNVSDIAFNALHGLSYEQRSYGHLARQTLDELLSRYFELIKQRDDTLRMMGI